MAESQHDSLVSTVNARCSGTYVHDRVFARTLVDKPSDNYEIHVSGGRLSPVKRMSTNPYSACEIRRKGGSADACAELVVLDCEVYAASTALNSENFAPGHVKHLSKAESWCNNTLTNGEYTSGPIDDITEAKRQIMLATQDIPTHILLSYWAAEVLASNWQFKDMIRDMRHADNKEPLGILPACFMGLEVIVATALTSSSYMHGMPYTSRYVWVDENYNDCCLVFSKRYGLNTLQPCEFGLMIEKVGEDAENSNECPNAGITCDFVFGCTSGSDNGVHSNGLATAGYLITGVTR